MSYEIIGKLSEIDLNTFVTRDENNKPILNEEMLKNLIVAAVSIVTFAALGDIVEAASVTKNYGTPTQLGSIFEFIHWLIDLVKWVFSGVIGAIFTFAGWRWGTDLSGNGQTEAKKIMKNCLIGGVIIWTGALIGDVFVGKLQEILTYNGTPL